MFRSHPTTVLAAATLWRTLRNFGGPGLILLGIADSSVVPLPGSLDALTIVLSASHPGWWPYYAVMATIGSVAGGYLTYRLGRKGGKETLEKKLSPRRVAKVYQVFEKHSILALVIPSLMPPPTPLSPFVLAAGALNMSLARFLTVFTSARLTRYLILGYVGSRYRRQLFAFFRHYYKPIFWFFVVLAVVGALAALYFWLRQRRRKTANAQTPPARVVA